MKLSVIIPVYRVESTLQRCVESVICQRIDDMEVILIDDGSPDSCPRLCDDWALRDARIRVIHKVNGGLSDARNAGIEVSTGDYITFVDSDDYLAPDTYAPLLEMMEGCDLLEYSVVHRLALNDHTYSNMVDYWLQSKAYEHTYAWNKIYRRELFREVRYPKGKIYKDVFALPQLLQKARRVTTTSRGAYHYCFNPQGITATANGSALAMLLEAHLGSKMPIDDDYYMYLVNIQIDVCEQTGNAITLPYKCINCSRLHGKKKLKAIILNTLGLKLLCRISKLIHHFRKTNR